ncbi:5'-nucleotidase [Mesonia maritima]|uniref:2',3'-cyclic-nucleotide 2'-phosphodiesterase (5'-nucleotidase family) n=1 Tax=Mesonia maritima TaxID=1793873 RepID=A0ABU1K5P9_9FLAO|nr:5'-nucleotidase [Mesonia maritima]MDR6300327.1 2',3'-cyclic-nucleotide 2'-phosphodiesterase (5'-nucleotidase family) [Mesonia maritima]
MKKIFFYTLLLLIGVSCKEENLKVSKITGEQIAIDTSLTSNESLDEFIAPFAENIEKEMNSVLAYAAYDLDKTDGKFNTAIGNMEADAVKEMLNPILLKRINDTLDAVLLNYGGIRSTIAKGKITTKTAYDIMPFENEAVVVQLNANTIRALFNYLAENKVAHPIAGMQLILKENGEIEKALVQNKPLDSTKNYLIATNNYLQQGGDNMDFFSKADTIYEMDYKLRNLFIDYFKKHDTIAPKRDERFIKLN